MIDEKLGITSDPYNLVLIVNPKRSKTRPNEWQGKKHYFPNFKLMAKAIADLKANEFLARGMPCSDEKSSGMPTHAPQIKHLDEVISGYCDYLQKHLENLTKVKI